MKGEIIRKLRNEKGLTQDELAKKLEVSASSIAMLESNRRSGNREVETKMANFFGVSRDFLAGVTSERIFNSIPRKQLVSELLESLVDAGMIDDINKIDKSTEKMIMDMVRTEMAIIKARKEK